MCVCTPYVCMCRQHNYNGNHESQWQSRVAGAITITRALSFCPTHTLTHTLDTHIQHSQSHTLKAQRSEFRACRGNPQLWAEVSGMWGPAQDRTGRDVSKRVPRAGGSSVSRSSEDGSGGAGRRRRGPPATSIKRPATDMRPPAGGPRSAFSPGALAAGCIHSFPRSLARSRARAPRDRPQRLAPHDSLLPYDVGGRAWTLVGRRGPGISAGVGPARRRRPPNRPRRTPPASLG